MQIEFDKKDLLTEYDFLTLMFEKDIYSIAELIVLQLSKYLIISNDKLYILQPDDKYTCEKLNNNKILVCVSKFISVSFKKLNNTESNKLLNQGDPFYRIFKNSFIYSFFPQLKVGLTNNDYNIL